MQVDGKPKDLIDAVEEDTRLLLNVVKPKDGSWTVQAVYEKRVNKEEDFFWMLTLYTEVEESMFEEGQDG